MSLRTLVIALAGMALGMVEAEPAISPEAIEQDWANQEALRWLPGPVTPEADAAGGCDGIKDGAWGFHTGYENQPWWQVDLGREYVLDHVTLFNRCQAEMAARAAQCRLLTSLDGVNFQQVYAHDGTVFGGFPDNAPLEVSLPGVSGRFLRIQLPGESYLHLDEVEVYVQGERGNAALGKAATQSSVSEWSKPHGMGQSPYMGVKSVVERGQRLVQHLQSLGAAIGPETARFEAAVQAVNAAPDAESTVLRREVHWAIRALALKNPLLDFEEILFVKRAPTLFPHVSDQYYGWFSRGGGGIYRLSGYKSDAAQIRCITESWPEGNFLRPDLAYDGTKVVFAYCRFYPDVAEISNKTQRENIPEDAFYHIFEMNLDGTGVRQLTHGRYNDFDARYLPNGDIVFLSTRKGIALQADRDSAAATCEAVLPDSYVRCGGDQRRPVPVFTLHRMDGDGGHICAISAFENFEWTPAIAQDGQILYARWDYIDRFNGHFMSLWATHPDGQNAQLVYGNYTVRPQCVFEARPIPGSNKLVFTATAHHSITGGSLVLLDRTRGTEFEAPLERITPEVCFPETEGKPNVYYAGPWPLSEEDYLVTWSDQPLPIHAYMKLGDPRNPPNASGLYLYDTFGNLTLLHRDPAISCETPIPLKPRLKPPVLADCVDWSAPKYGSFLVQDIYQGMPEITRGSIARLRIVGVIPKVQPFMNQPSLGISAEDPGKFIVGTVPVEADGSAYFYAPSGIPLFFQALDEQGMAVRTMRTLTYLQPGRTLACIGCHESRDSAPVTQATRFAARREPSQIRPEPEGSWPLRYDALVQPVLDNACVACHQPGYTEAKAAAIDLTPVKSYETLMAYGGNDLHDLAFEKNVSEVGDCPARKSKLRALLTAEGGHAGLKLDPASLSRLTVWMDTYAHRQGAFSPEQETALRNLRAALEPIIEQPMPVE